MDLAAFRRDIGYHGHGHFFEIFYRDEPPVIWVAGIGYNHDNPLVEPPIVFEPTPPEPIEVLARHVFHRTEEVIRRGMLICPAMQVGFESTVEADRKSTRLNSSN